jgi:Uma2 family endonuclease
MTERQDFFNKPKIQKKYNLTEFLEFTKDKEEQYELIDGKIYMMASPNVGHQNIAGEIFRKIGNYLEGKTCRPFISPLDVVLFKKEKKNAQNVFQPDVFVVCDPKKISKDRIYGAPDLVFEVVSPSSDTHDYFKKFVLYMKYGVKEYWIINPDTKQIFVHINGEEDTKKYSFDDKVKVSIFADFYIDFKELQI